MSADKREIVRVTYAGNGTYHLTDDENMKFMSLAAARDAYPDALVTVGRIPRARGGAKAARAGKHAKRGKK